MPQFLSGWEVIIIGAMENTLLTQANLEIGAWMMGHPGFSWDQDRKTRAYRLLQDGSVIYIESCDFDDPDDMARAINALLNRARRISEDISATS